VENRSGFFNKLSIELPYDSSILFLQRIENRCSHKYWYMNIHSSTIHKSQKVKPTQMPFNGQMNKQMWYIRTMENYPFINGTKYGYLLQHG
jgi:hypothetical protein